MQKLTKKMTPLTVCHRSEGYINFFIGLNTQLLNGRILFFQVGIPLLAGGGKNVVQRLSSSMVKGKD